MEAEWMAKRATLRWLLHTHPEWTQNEYAAFLHCSVGWVKKWRKRLKEAPPDDLSVFHARSRARRTPFPLPDPAVVERIVQIRQVPPENLQRVPGSRTILYYLHRDTQLQAQGVKLPRSARTIWKILHQEGLILPLPVRQRKPLPKREPLEEVQVDFKDVTTVPPDPQGKHQHVVETCNFVDAGTSILLEAQVRDDFRAETAFDAVVAFLRRYGLPSMLTFDRDPRWVGSQSGRDFPSAFRRFLLCLGIEPNVCPPQQPQKQAYVERFHRSYKYECLLIHRPGTLSATVEVTRQYQQHYNWERPHQGRSCQNLPPRVRFSELPGLPALPLEVDPDRWLERLHGHAYVRHVGSDGCVTVDSRPYYVGLEHKGKTVALLLHSPDRHFEVWDGPTRIRRLPIKGLHGAPMLLEPFIAWMREQAVAEEWRGTFHTRAFGWRQLGLWDDASA